MDGPKRPAKEEETMQVPSGEMGRIIGRGGETINQLQQDSGAKIDILKDQGMVRLSGTSDAIARARSLISELLERTRDNHGSQGHARVEKVEDTMEVHGPMIGRIIGKGGESIRQLQQDSGAKIDILKDESVVRMSGSCDSVAHARRLITALIERPDDRGDNRGDNRRPFRPSLEEETLQVPQNMVGKIIGKGGETIRRLQEESHCKIDVTKDQPGVIRLSGTRETITAAKHMIDDVIDSGVDGKGGGKGKDDGPRVNETMVIPAEMVEHVVGKNGGDVKSLEATSGAHVEIDTKDNVFQLNLSGSRYAVERAQSLILDKMEHAAADMESGGSFPPNPPGGGWPGGGGGDWQGMLPAPPPMPDMNGGGGGGRSKKEKRGGGSSSSSSSSPSPGRKQQQQQQPQQQWAANEGQANPSWAAWQAAGPGGWAPQAWPATSSVSSAPAPLGGIALDDI